MRSGLALIPFMIILPVIFVSASHFLPCRLLFLPGEFIYLGRLRVLLLRLQFVVVLCRVVLQKSELTLRAVTQIGNADFETLGPRTQFLSSTCQIH